MSSGGQMKQQITVRFDRETLDKMDNLILKKKYDNRPSLVRRAVNDFLEQFDETIIA